MTLKNVIKKLQSINGYVCEFIIYFFSFESERQQHLRASIKYVHNEYEMTDQIE